jgi:sigma-B regulation protein RsbU (phosphoserine phosphatase)
VARLAAVGGEKVGYRDLLTRFDQGWAGGGIGHAWRSKGKAVTFQGDARLRPSRVTELVPTAGSALAGARAPLRALPPPSDERVLVVDDIEANRDLLVRRLRRMGIEDVVQAADGRAALEIIRTTRLDLVLLDIMMPVMTGFDVLDALANEGRIEGLPVIVISAMDEMDAIVRAIRLGAEDFLLKPFDPTLLRARVETTLEKKRLRDRMRGELVRKQVELAEARVLQLALAPPPYGDAHIQIEVVLEPAREIGGDLVDHVPLPDGRHLLAVGDVSDKGAGAALVMARIHALVRGLATRPDAAAIFGDPARAARKLNATLAADNDSCMFATMLLAVFDAASGRLDYVRCGHIPPFLLRRGGAVERLDGVGGLALGISEAAQFVAGEAWLEVGDVILILSDGLTEAEAPDGSMFGDDGIIEWLSGSETRLASLVARVRAHEGDGPQSDDVSALLLRYHG